MNDRLCLDFLTAPDLPAADLVHLAADLGLGRVSLLLVPVLGLPDYGLSAPGPERHAAQRALRDTGVRLDMAEPFYVTADTVTADLLPLLDIAAELGARLVNLLARTPDLPRLGQQMGEICAAAQDRGLGIVTEISKRGSLVTLDQTARFIRDYDLPMTIELDALHFWRAGGDPADLPIHAAQVGRIQLCDVRPGITPADEPSEALSDRALPGAGIADLPGFLRPLPRSAVIGIEVPQPGIPGPMAARRALAATRNILKTIGESA